jgi:hypothetical protein
MAPAADPASAWLTCGSVSAYVASWRMPRRGNAGGGPRATPPTAVLSTADGAVNGVDVEDEDATRAAFASARSNMERRQSRERCETALGVAILPPLASAAIPRVSDPLASPLELSAPVPPRDPEGSHSRDPNIADTRSPSSDARLLLTPRLSRRNFATLVGERADCTCFSYENKYQLRISGVLYEQTQ